MVTGLESPKTSPTKNASPALRVRRKACAKTNRAAICKNHTVCPGEKKCAKGQAMLAAWSAPASARRLYPTKPKGGGAGRSTARGKPVADQGAVTPWAQSPAQTL
jgi:hypothetical protein